MMESRKTIDCELATEAKSIVALAFRNGPIEDVHSGRPCPTCSGNAEYSRITQEEMKCIMQKAVDTVYRLLWLKDFDRQEYENQIKFGSLYTKNWDDPHLKKRPRIGSAQ